MVILGIDTALRCSGYGVIRVTGKQFQALDCGVIKNSPRLAHSECLRRLTAGVVELIERFHPDLAAIEGGFYLKNAKTAMVLGMARGCVIGALAQHRIPCYEYAPARAKQAITGYGRATKDEVARVMRGLLGLDIRTIPEDATDALSLAICHALISQSRGGVYLKPPL